MLWLCLGLMLWIFSYWSQRQHDGSSPIVPIPHWLALVFGNPRREDRVELHSAQNQFFGLIWVVTGMVLGLTRSEIQTQVVIGIIVFFLATPMLFMPVAFVERKIIKQYHSVIENSFGQPLENYGFKKAKAHDNLVIFDSPSGRIRVRAWKWETLVVTLEPISTGQKVIDTCTDELDLLIIIYCLGEKSVAEVKFDLNTQPTLDVANSAWGWLHRYCAPMLQGDWNMWTQLQACKREYVTSHA